MHSMLVSSSQWCSSLNSQLYITQLALLISRHKPKPLFLLYRKYIKNDIPSCYVLVFLNLLTQQMLQVFFLLTGFPLILYIYIYTSKLQFLQAFHILRTNELITNSSNFQIATFFSAFVSFIYLLLFLFAFVMMHYCIMK